MSISYYSNLIVEHFAFPLETVSSLVEKSPHVFAASRNIFYSVYYRRWRYWVHVLDEENILSKIFHSLKFRSKFLTSSKNLIYKFIYVFLILKNDVSFITTEPLPYKVLMIRYDEK